MPWIKFYKQNNYNIFITVPMKLQMNKYLGKEFLLTYVFCCIYRKLMWAFQVALVVKNLPSNAGRKRHGFNPWVRKIWVQSLGWEDPLEKSMATHSSILACGIPWTQDPGRLQSMGLQRVRHEHWRRKWQPTSVFLPGESRGQWSLMGCQLWGRTESDTTEVT